MRRLAHMPQKVLLLAAVLFAVSITAYTAISMYYMHAPRSVATLGFELRELPGQSQAAVASLTSGGPAEKAGLRRNDVVRSINGQPLRGLAPYYDAVVRGQPGDRVTFEVQSENHPARAMAIELAPPPASDSAIPLTSRLAEWLADSYPLWFLVVALAVLFQRLDDGHAWLLALLFACFIAGPEYQEIIPRLHPALRNAVFAYGMSLAYLGSALFYCFFTLFPNASPLERRAPWLKWAAIALAAILVVPSAISALTSASFYPFYVHNGWVAPAVFQRFRQWHLFAFVALGFVALIGNTLRARDAHARRRVRVILWGTLAGFGPMITVFFLSIFTQHPVFSTSALRVICNLLLTLVPISFGYAVVKHRVMEMPVLLKRSARYVIVRHGLDFLLAAALAVVVLFMWQFAGAALHGWQGGGANMAPTEVDYNQVVTLVFILGLASGVVLAATQRRVRQTYMQRLDRAFFRSAYDARQIMQDLAEKARSVSTREQLALLLRQHIREALHPRSLAVYFEASCGVLRRQRPPEELPETLSTDSPLLKELASHGRPWEIPPSDTPAAPGLPQLASLRAFLDEEFASPAAEGDIVAALAPLEPECLVPLLGNDGRLVGMVVLGQRRSEEPYSDEDERLLASVAGQAASALENIGLAESMAQKIEAERKAAGEIAIARDVQAQLFPQKQPPMSTLEYTGMCDQARKVGGDYYDFLDLGAGRIGLVLADISGKGIFAALLMANLQANLRSQYARALDDLRGLMCSVNRLFQQSTSTGLYATMFFADYADATRRLRYVNCGHNPPLLLRADGSHQRLESTATVIGLVEEWDCEVGETELRPGDALVIYSDGVTEAQSDEQEFFGEQRLLLAARDAARLPVAEAARAIAQTVHTFSGSAQEDDLTLVLARAR
ncbi:MAG: SpoIIE family protein phosphatase [Candidatus Acidiferrales bacterium]